MPETEKVIILRGHHIPVYELFAYGDREDVKLIAKNNRHAGYGKAFTQHEFGVFRKISEGSTHVRVKLVASEADSLCEVCPIKDSSCFDPRITYDADDIRDYGFELNQTYTSREFNEGIIKKQGRSIERD